MLLKNLSANLAVGILGPVIAILFTPFLINRLGIEGFGAVGFFAVLSVVVQVFAQGINTTLERKIASGLGVAETRGKVEVLFATLQRLYWIVGGLIFAGIAVAAGPLSLAWTERDGLARPDAQLTVVLGGAMISIGLITGLYSSLFIGLAQQVFLSTAAMIAIMVQTGLAYILVSARPQVSSYLMAQVLAALIPLILIRLRTGRVFSSAGKLPPADFKCLREEARFSLSLIAIEGLGVVVTYIDRILIVAMLPLHSLGRYNVAQTGSKGLGILRGPFSQAFTPVIFRWASSNNFQAIRPLFWKIQTILMIIVGVPAVVLMLAAQPLLQFWLKNEELVLSIQPSFRWLAAAGFFMVLSGPAYLVMLSRNYTRSSLVYNVSAALIMMLVGPPAVHRFGMEGAAVVWFVYCAGSTVLTHAGVDRVLYAETSRAFFGDVIKFLLKVGLPVAVAAVCCYSIIFFTGVLTARPALVAFGCVAGLAMIFSMATYVCVFGFKNPREISQEICNI